MKKWIQLAEVFQDGMLLQRRKPILIWGEARQTESVQVLWNGMEIYRGDIPAGQFRISLPALEAFENGKLTIENASGESFTIRNVDIGEVWIAGGQSNMEFALSYDRDADAVIAAANDEHLRYYEVGKFAFAGEREENIKYGAHRWFHWRKFTPEECTHFSAVATYFARELRKELQVPVGILGCNWGGTSASAWMEDALLRQDEVLRVYTDAYDAAVAKLNLEKYIQADRKSRTFMGSEKSVVDSDGVMKKEVKKPVSIFLRPVFKLLLAQQASTGPHDPNRPGGLYQVMLRQIAGYTASGVIWYQGESDEHHAPLYARLQEAMIRCWRRDWQEELPFLMVQLAPWEEWNTMTGVNYPILREQQQIVEDTVAGVHMASIMDIGSRFDIHPKEKAPVGHRLALLALEHVYQLPQPHSHSPRMVSVTRSGKEISVKFDQVLEDMGSCAPLFCLKQQGKRVPCSANVEGNMVRLSCPKLAAGEAELAFAYEPFLVMPLFNQGGLPARPFAPQMI